jgi:hypothetical protein
MIGYKGPAQPSTLGDALNARYRYLEVKCLGCHTHQTVAFDIVRRPKTTPVHELERYMRCKDCAQVRGYPFKRSHLVALRPTKISASRSGQRRFLLAIRPRRGGRGNGESNQNAGEPVTNPMSFDAYGDESAGAGFVAYGTLLLPTASREAVEAKIAKLKIDYGASAVGNLHCRVLFSGDARGKTAWSKLAVSDVFDLYSDLVALVKPSLTRTIVTTANKAGLLRQWGDMHSPRRPPACRVRAGGFFFVLIGHLLDLTGNGSYNELKKLCYSDHASTREMLTIVVGTVALAGPYRPLRRFATLAVSQPVAFRRFATFCDARPISYVLTVIARDSAK